MITIKHIVFDIGRVLIRYDAELPYKHLIPDEAERRWFLDNVCTIEWNIEQDRGRTWVDAEQELIAKFPDHATLIRAFRTYWHEMTPGPVEGSFPIMQELIDTGHDVTLLTNFSSDTFVQALEMYPGLKAPRGATVSGDVKLIKPDIAIYHHHTTSFDLDPAATLFVDDSPPNIATARDHGWHAHEVTDARMLRNVLECYELVPMG